jgi:hypothetical protein
VRSTPMGRTCTSEKPRPLSSCEGRSRLRSLGACVLSPASRACQASGGEEGEKRPSVAPILPDYADTDSQRADRSAARWNTHLRFALTTGLRFSAYSNEKHTTQKGDISKKLTMGTFLKSFDNRKGRYCASRLTVLSSYSPIRPGAESGLFFENCPRTILSRTSIAGLSRLVLNPMSTDVQC